MKVNNSSVMFSMNIMSAAASHINCQELVTGSTVQLCDGASSAERQRWFLKPPQEFHYLNQSTCYNLPRVSNADEYRVGFPIAVHAPLQAAVTFIAQ